MSTRLQAQHGKRADHVLVHESGSIVVVIEHAEGLKSDDVKQVKGTSSKLREQDSIYRTKLEQSAGVRLRPDFLNLPCLHKEKKGDRIVYRHAAHAGIPVANCVDYLLRRLAETLGMKCKAECTGAMRRRSFCEHVPSILQRMCSELEVKRACDILEELQES